MDDKLQPITLDDIVLGMPLACSLYDKVGRLLLPEGTVIDSVQQIEAIAENGLYRGNDDDAGIRRREAAAATDADKHKPVEKVEDLLSVKIAIGDTLQLQDFSANKQRYFVKLIGYTNKKSVLVSHPRQDDKLSYIKEGSGFLVRGFAGTKTYEFNTNVVSVCLTPYPYLHLAFPQQVKTTNMRSAVRIKLKLVCSIESVTTGLKVPAFIEDFVARGGSSVIGRGVVERCGSVRAEEVGQHPLTEDERVYRHALVDAVEHPGEVEVGGQPQRCEAVAGDAERRECLVVGAAAHAGTGSPGRRGRARPSAATIASTRSPCEGHLEADVAHDDLDLDVVADDPLDVGEHLVLGAGQRAHVDRAPRRASGMTLCL